MIVDLIRRDWAWLNAIIGPVDEDMELAAREQPAEQERPELVEFFEWFPL